MGARTKVSWAPVLVVVPLIGNAQLDMGAGLACSESRK